MNGRGLVLVAVADGAEDFASIVDGVPVLRRREVRYAVEELMIAGLVEGRHWISGELYVDPVRSTDPSARGRLAGIPYVEHWERGSRGVEPRCRFSLSDRGGIVVAAMRADASAG